MEMSRCVGVIMFLSRDLISDGVHILVGDLSFEVQQVMSLRLLHYC